MAILTIQSEILGRASVLMWVPGTAVLHLKANSTGKAIVTTSQLLGITQRSIGLILIRGEAKITTRPDSWRRQTLGKIRVVGKAKLNAYYFEDRDIMASIKDYLPNYYRGSNEAQGLTQSLANEFIRTSALGYDILNQFYPNTTTWGLERWESDFNITVLPSEDVFHPPTPVIGTTWLQMQQASWDYLYLNNISWYRALIGENIQPNYIPPLTREYDARRAEIIERINGFPVVTEDILHEEANKFYTTVIHHAPSEQYIRLTVMDTGVAVLSAKYIKFKRRMEQLVPCHMVMQIIIPN